MFTDIKSWDWIEKLPQGMRGYVYLARLDRPIGIWLLLLPSLWGIVLAAMQLQGFSFKVVYLIIAFMLGAVVMRSAGCVINDLWDRKLDAQVERTRTRPLASGQISVGQALVFLAGLLMSGFCILITLSPSAILLGVFSVPLVAVYPLMKRVTFWPQAFLGLTFNFGALMGWAAVMDGVSLSAVLLYGAGILWTLGYDTIYAYQDKDDDALIGVKSTALKFGTDSKKWLSGFYAGMLVCLACVFALSSLNVLAFPGLALVGAHLFWQIARLDIDDPASALAVFKSNRDLGVMVLAVILIGGF